MKLQPVDQQRIRQKEAEFKDMNAADLIRIAAEADTIEESDAAYRVLSRRRDSWKNGGNPHQLVYRTALQRTA